MRTLKTLPALGITLAIDGGEFVMTGPTGRHTLAASATTQGRLDAHFKGFVQAGIQKLAEPLSDWLLLCACLGPTTAMFRLTTEDDERARVLCDGVGPNMSAAMDPVKRTSAGDFSRRFLAPAPCATHCGTRRHCGAV